MKRSIAKLFAFLIVASIFLSACTPSSGDTTTAGTTASSGTTTTASSGTTAATEVERAERLLRMTFRETPKTFNPHRNDGEYDMHKLLSANLYARIVDPETGWSKYVPELADGYPVQMDDAGLVWQIKILPGFTFEDGYPIDAYAFEYSFKMLNDPKLLNRNENSYAFVGCEAYHAGEAEWEEVTGYQVLDPYTIQVTFIPDEEPLDGAADVMEVFGWMGSSLVHPEVYEKGMNADRTETSYGTTPDMFVASGQYRLADFIEGQYMEYEKRNDAPLAEVFTADRITWQVTVDDNVDLLLYESGEIDVARANPAKYDEYPDLYYYNSAFVYGIFVNPMNEANAVLRDVNFRYALYWGLDRAEIVKAAYPTYEPQAWLYPAITKIKDPNDKTIKLDYRSSAEAQAIRLDGHEVTELGYEPERALDYFNRAYEANGNKPITIEIQYSDGGEAPMLWAEAIQECYLNLFGRDRLTINLVSVPDQVALEALFRTAMDYEVVAARRVYQIVDDEPWANTNWISDGHPYSYSTQYCVLTPDAQARFTELFDEAYFGPNKKDQAFLNKVSAQVEELILNDCTFIPVYNDRNRMLISPWLTSLLPNGHYDLLAGYYWMEWDDALYAASK